MPRLKSWESPRRQGRNDKGKGGSKKKKQWLKRQQMLRNKLKNQQNNQKDNQGGRLNFPFFMSKIIKPTFINRKYHIRLLAQVSQKSRIQKSKVRKIEKIVP